MSVFFHFLPKVGVKVFLFLFLFLFFYSKEDTTVALDFIMYDGS